jgi:hypothetical protein
MQHTSPFLRNAFFAIAAILLFSSCMKDKLTKTYSIYVPVYKTKQEVLASVKTTAVHTIESPGKIYVSDNFIFLNELNKGVHIIDNSNASSPRTIGFVNIPGNVDIAVKGNVLYADMYSDLLAVDISNPSAAKLLKSIPKVFPERNFGVGYTRDTNLVIVDWVRKDTTVTVGNEWGGGACPNCLYLADFQSMMNNSVASAAGIGGSMARFTLVNDYLYTVGPSELTVFSVANAADPVVNGKQSVGMNIETIFPFKNKLFIGSATGMFIYTIDNPVKPLRESSFDHVRACDPVIADDNYAYVTLRTGTGCGGSSNLLHVLDVSTITSPRVVKTYQLKNPHGLTKDGNLLFICDGIDGLKLYDASDVNNLTLLQHIKDIETYDAIAWNKRLLVVGTNGISQFDYSDGKSMKLLSTLAINKQ